MCMRRSVATTALLLIFLAAPAMLAQNAQRKPAHTIHAVRASEKITIDGILNDAVWMAAPVEVDFTQRDPIEGVKPSERTEIRVAYDDTSIYFGVRLFDKEPDKIVRQLSRRDDGFDADYFTLQLSPNHDRLTGAEFDISAAGVQRDAIISNDTFTDYSWEGVWESAVHVDDEGWSVEMRIPFSQLRFPGGDHQIWGINAARYIHRKNETVWLQMVPKNQSGTASRMDDLEGIDGLEAHRHLDLMPFIAGRSDFTQPSPGDPFNNGSRFSGRAGLDVKYGVSSNFTLDATVNPDFGQVEVDPAVVNISQFETFFPEKRPFFLEGANIFNNFGQIGSNNNWGFNRAEPNLFYSRRIGRAPQGLSTATPADATNVFVDPPTATTILGAGKLTGKTRNGWTFGLVEGLTNRDRASVSNKGQVSQVEVEPLTNYMVARVLRETNRAGVGFLSTEVDRSLSVPALRDLLPQRAHMVGADGYWYIDPKKDWVVYGKLSGSSVSGDAKAMSVLQNAPQHYFQRPDASEVSLQSGATSMSGWTGSVNLNRQSGDITVNSALWGVSPGFESNDVGFQTNGDSAGAHTVVLWKKPTPDRLTRQRSAWLAKWWTWDYGRRNTGDGWNSSMSATFMNYWSAFAGFGGHRTTRDDQLTRGGPAALNLSGSFFNAGFNTDSRKTVSLGYNFFAAKNQPTAFSLSSGVSINYKPTPSITISTGPNFDKSHTNAQYVTYQADPTAIKTYGGRYVFADIDQFDVQLTTRVNWILSPKMSVQVFTQPLISIGRYWDYKEFAQPSTYSFNRYGKEIGSLSFDSMNNQYVADPDGDGPAPPIKFSDPSFNDKFLIVNAIFRWEWRLGSTFYFVWTENRLDTSNPGTFSPGRDVGKLFSAHPNDIFLVRLAYWSTK